MLDLIDDDTGGLVVEQAVVRVVQVRRFGMAVRTPMTPQTSDALPSVVISLLIVPSSASLTWP